LENNRTGGVLFIGAFTGQKPSATLALTLLVPLDKPLGNPLETSSALVVDGGRGVGVGSGIGGAVGKGGEGSGSGSGIGVGVGVGTPISWPTSCSKAFVIVPIFSK